MSNKFVQAQTFTLAGAGPVIGDTTILLSSFNGIDGTPLVMSYFGSKGFATLEPNGSNEEQISFTGITQNSNGTATLTGVSSVSFIYPYTETSGLAQTHAGGSALVISNTSGFYNQFLTKDNDQTVNGVMSFNAVPNSVNPPVSGTDLANKQYVLDVVTGGTLTFNQVVVAGSAGETVALGDFLYLKEADGLWWKTNALTASTVDNVQLAIAMGAGTAGNAITGGVLISGVMTLSSLTANTKYFYTDVAGTIGTSAGTTEVTAGYAISTTLLYFAPRYDQQITGKIQDALTPGGAYGTPSASNPYLTKDYNASSTGLPTVQVLTPNTPVGSSTSRFDITNVVSTTYRYTWDGTGTNPNINVGTFPIGTVVDIQGQDFASGNKGLFVTTGVGANYFEITNASGVAENDKTLGTGYINTGGVYTKPAGLKYAVIEVLGGGGGAGGSGTSESVASRSGTRSIFNHSTALIGNGGGGGTRGGQGGTGGIASGGDIASTGQAAGNALNGNIISGFWTPGAASVLGKSYGAGGDGTAAGASGSSVSSGSGGGAGGYSKALISAGSLAATINYSVGYKGTAATGAGSGAASGTDGTNGVIIITEYYS